MLELRRIARRRRLYILRAIIPAAAILVEPGWGEPSRDAFGWLVLAEFVLLAIVAATSLGAWRMRQEQRTGGLDLATIAGESSVSTLLRVALSGSLLPLAIGVGGGPILALLALKGGISWNTLLQGTTLLAASILFGATLGAAILMILPSFRWGMAIGLAAMGCTGVIWPVAWYAQGNDILSMAAWHPGAALYVAVADPFALDRVGGVHVPIAWILAATASLLPIAWTGRSLVGRFHTRRVRPASPVPALARFLPPLGEDTLGGRVAAFRRALPRGSPGSVVRVAVTMAVIAAIVWIPWNQHALVMREFLAVEMALLLGAAVLSASTTFTREKDRGTFPLVLSAPVDGREALFATKCGLTLRLGYLLLIPFVHTTLLRLRGDLSAGLYVVALVVMAVSLWACLNVGLLASVRTRTSAGAVTLGLCVLAGISILTVLLHPFLLFGGIVAGLFVLARRAKESYYRTDSWSTGCLSILFMGALYGLGCVVSALAMGALLSTGYRWGLLQRIIAFSPVFLTGDGLLVRLDWEVTGYLGRCLTWGVPYVLAGSLLAWWVPRRFDKWTGRCE